MNAWGSECRWSGLATKFWKAGSADVSRCLLSSLASVGSALNICSKASKLFSNQSVPFQISHLFTTPSYSSIILNIVVWSEESIGAMEMSRTALNLPQLLRCSFSSRKKFQTNRLKTSNGARIDVIKSPLTILFSVKMNDASQINLRMVSSIIAK